MDHLPTVLIGGIIVQQTFSPVGRVQQAQHDIREAEDMFEGVQLKAPQLPAEEGRKLVKHCVAQGRNLAGLKLEANALMVKLKKVPFWKRHSPWSFRKELGDLEVDVNDLCEDGVNTTAMVDRIITGNEPKDVMRVGKLRNMVARWTRPNTTSLFAHSNRDMESSPLQEDQYYDSP